MKRAKTSYEQAVEEYNKYFGQCPTVNQINDLYHKYRIDWKHYNGFTDWLNYYTA